MVTSPTCSQPSAVCTSAAPLGSSTTGVLANLRVRCRRSVDQVSASVTNARPSTSPSPRVKAPPRGSTIGSHMRRSAAAGRGDDAAVGDDLGDRLPQRRVLQHRPQVQRLVADEVDGAGAAQRRRRRPRPSPRRGASPSTPRPRRPAARPSSSPRRRAAPGARRHRPSAASTTRVAPAAASSRRSSSSLAANGPPPCSASMPFITASVGCSGEQDGFQRGAAWRR